MKNPILNFQSRSDSETFVTELGKYNIKNGVHRRVKKALNNNFQLSTTLITKTREATDMTESSFE